MNKMYSRNINLPGKLKPGCLVVFSLHNNSYSIFRMRQLPRGCIKESSFQNAAIPSIEITLKKGKEASIEVRKTDFENPLEYTFG